MGIYSDMKEIPETLKKPFDALSVEKEIYGIWEKSGYFTPENLPLVDGKERDTTYSIVLPPPNVTGILHVGHALMLVIQDILIRFKRMNGYKTLWVPGTDHAAIATQSVVEKEIYKKENKSRYDLGREELLSRVNDFAKNSQGTIISQIKAMGASLDFTREAFTLDEPRNKAVLTAFKKMYDDGLIYRGTRIVNFDPKGGTTVSDDEVEMEERDAILYTFKYSSDFPIYISSTRPETKVGDSAVAVHPDDERYKEYIGKEFSMNFAGAPIKILIVADVAVDKEFGTGALGVTPAHSQIDWEIKERHNLDVVQVIDERGKMMESAGELLKGKKVAEARELVVNWLKENELLESEEKIKQNVPTAQRTGGIIEPLPKLQWFVAVNKSFNHFGKETTLKALMKEAVEGKGIEIIPERFEKVYFHWIDNLRDWCISRQIWYGHRIPVWYKDGEVYCDTDAPTEDGWTQDEDTLDTWFSSGLWTFSTLGWPDQTNDLKTYHPTDVMETGHDILFFWVARMILFSKYLLNEIPFKIVYLHGLVRDAQGRKMSKSLGNTMDPLVMIEKYGTDALRLALIAGTGPGNDTKLSEDKIRGYKHFANKIWNASRFVLERTSDLDVHLRQEQLSVKYKSYYDSWHKIREDITVDIENYRLSMAAEKIYDYFWHTFADIIIEEAKKDIVENTIEKRSAQTTLLLMLRELLIVLHPFIPFVTEEVWKFVKESDDDLIMVTSWK